MKKNLLVLFLLNSFTLFANHEKGSFSIGLGGDMGYLYSIGDINDKITTTGSGIVDFIPDASTLNWNYNFDFSVGYSLTKTMRISLYANYLMLSKSISESFSPSKSVYTGTNTMTAGYYEFATGLTAIGFGPLFTYFFIDAGNFAFSTTIGLLYYPSIKFYQDTTYASSASSTGALDANLKSIDASGSSFGGLIKFSADYYFNRHFALGFDLGYNYIKAPTLTDDSGNTINFSYLDGSTSTSNTPLAINASNIFAGLSLRYEFGGSGSSDYVNETSSYSEMNNSNTNTSQNDSVIITDDSANTSNTQATEEVVEQTSNYLGEDDFQQEEPTIQDLKYKVQELYQDAKDNGLRKRKRKLGKIYKYIKRKKRRWRRMSAKSKAYYIKKISKKIERAEQINR